MSLTNTEFNSETLHIYWQADRDLREKISNLAREGKFIKSLELTRKLSTEKIKNDTFGDISGCMATQGHYEWATEVAKMMADLSKRERNLALTDIENLKQAGSTGSIVPVPCGAFLR